MPDITITLTEAEAERFAKTCMLYADLTAQRAEKARHAASESRIENRGYYSELARESDRDAAALRELAGKMQPRP